MSKSTVSLSNPTVGGDGSWSRYSRLLAVFAVCVALLCVLLLSFTIVQSVKLNDMTGERDQLQISYDNVSVERDQLQAERDQLQAERDELQKWSKMW
ncbi:C-type lectin domain family 4 member F-like isoform X1, partial [Tachysurus ichikawai]